MSRRILSKRHAARAGGRPTLELLTNDEVIAVDQRSDGNRPLFEKDGFVAWTANVPGSRDRYLALFNTRDRPPLDAPPPAGSADLAGAEVRVALAELGLPARCRGRDLWTHDTLSSAERELVAVVPWHGARLYRLSPEG